MCSTNDPLAELASAMGRLGEHDLTQLVGPALLDRLTALLPALNRLQAEVARTVRQAELAGAAEHDGLRTMTSWLRGHARLSPTAAARSVRNGRTLEAMPAVAAAAASGQVPADQVSLLARVVTPENLAAASAELVDVSAVDVTVARVAATCSYGELARVVQHYLDRLDPDGPEPDPTEQRSLVMAKHADGSLDGRFHLDPVGAEKFQAALEAHLQADRPAGDERSHAQRAGDALVQLCDNLLASGTLPFLRRIKPHLFIHIDLPDLVDPGKGPAVAEAGFGAMLSAARTRWAACDPDVTRIVLGPDSQPMDVGRTERLVPPHIRRAVEVRDKTCVFAGCGAPTWWCEVHHLLEWILDEGETSVDNSGLLCERHHTKVHHGFRIERDAANRWRTYRPDGSEIPALVRPRATHPGRLIRRRPPLWVQPR